MKYSEICFASLFIASFLMKRFHIVGSSILICFASLGLVFLYCLFGFALFNGLKFREIFEKAKYENINFINIITTIFAGISSSLMVFSILFKIQNWPGYYMIMFFSSILCIIMILISLIGVLCSNAILYKQILTRVLLLFIINFILYLFNLPVFFAQKG